MEERERTARISPEIYVYATNKNFLNLYDALRIDKVKLEIAGYDPATNRQTGQANAWLDVDDARLLCHLISFRLFPKVTGGKWEKFGGSQKDDGFIESRIVLIEWEEGEKGEFARNPYKITIANGPGRKTATGGVSPNGPPKSRLFIRLPETDMMKVMLALSDYIHAYEAAHHHRIVADRVRELRGKLAGRAERSELREQQPAPTRIERAPREPQPTTTSQPLHAIAGGASRGPRPATPAANMISERSHLTPIRGEKAM